MTNAAAIGAIMFAAALSRLRFGADPVPIRD
jgi:hypothetical protein